MTGSIRTLGFGLALTASLSAAPAKSQTAEDFFKGKKIDMIIGYSAGGTYDLYARLIARQMGNYLPGNPVIVPRNMPGGGSVSAFSLGDLFGKAFQGRGKPRKMNVREARAPLLAEERDRKSVV